MTRNTSIALTILIALVLSACRGGGSTRRGTSDTDMHFAVTGYPSATRAGTSHTFTVTALDANNGTATDYAGTVQFTSTDTHAILPANATLTSGTGIFSATLNTVGAQSITATDTVMSSFTGSQTDISVSASGAATHFTVTGYPSSTIAGISHTYTVTADDDDSNVRSYPGTVRFTSTDGAATLPSNATLISGKVTFNATLNTAGSHSITATATDAVTSSFTGSQAGIIVHEPGAATHFTITDFPSPATAGTSHTFTVTALDASNNIATGYTTTVQFSSTDSAASLPANTKLTGGIGTFNATLNTVGTHAITATDIVMPSITGSQTGIIANTARGLVVTINGLTSPNLDADVTITGPGTHNQHLSATQTLADLTDGTYTLTAGAVTDPNQTGLGRGHNGSLGPVNLQRYPLIPLQAVTVRGGVGEASVDYPAATLTLQIPQTGSSGTVAIDFVLVPAGSFTMGSNDTLDGGNGTNTGVCQPSHVVTIDAAFYIAKTEMTQEQWLAVMRSNPSINNTANRIATSNPTHPVDLVSWTSLHYSTSNSSATTPDGTSFLEMLNTVLPGYGFRLPSEAEYEYVCRAGTQTAYFFGNDSTNLSLYAVMNNRTAYTNPVASLAPNPWGLYDIIGNVWQWLEDDFHSGNGLTIGGYTNAPVDGSAWVNNPDGSPFRVLRGGSCFSLANYSNVAGCRSASRNYDLRFSSANVGLHAMIDPYGFRLVFAALRKP